MGDLAALEEGESVIFDARGIAHAHAQWQRAALVIHCFELALNATARPQDAQIALVRSILKSRR